MSSGVPRLRNFLGATVTRVPVVTYSLIGINVAVFFATAFSQGGTIEQNEQSSLFRDLVLAPYFVGYGHEYQRLITAAFLHIGPVHLALNMFALGMLGPGLETVLGWWRFLSVYLLGALGGSVAILVFGQVLAPVAGASGAIFGLFASALVLSRVVGFDTRALWITVGINFVITFSVPGISRLGHLGGFVLGGLATAAILEWTLQPKAPQRRRVDRQIVGLAGLFGALVVVAAIRVYNLGHNVLTG